MNFAGWGGLCRLSSSMLNRGTQSKPGPIGIDELETDAEDLICLLGSDYGHALDNSSERVTPPTANLQTLKEIFSDRLYLELQMQTPTDEPNALWLAQFAKKLQISTVATHQVYYLEPEHAGLQRVASAIRTIRPLANQQPGDTAPPNAYFAPQDEVVNRFVHFPQAISNTVEISERCNLDLPIGEPHYPSLPEISGSPADQLRQKAYAGAARFYGEVTSVIQERLDYELSVINQAGYSPLFLIMQDILQYADRSNIPHASRGSASSSLVAHCLGITSPDPINLNLYFERFLNPARATPPDIDTDLCSRRRDEIIDYVGKRYGRDRVAMVATINRFRSRSALREVAKAYGLSPGQISRLTNSLPERWYGPPETNSQRSSSPYESLKPEFGSELYLAIFRDAESMRGIPHHLSIHPGGIVITPESMTRLVPTQLATKGIVITQFDLDSIERLGLIKIDLLGIRGLTVLGDVLASPNQMGSSIIDTPIHRLDDIPARDQQTEQLLARTATIGCFQIESPGMRLTLRELQAKTIEDIMVALALFRPGPLTGGLKNQFVQRYRNRQDKTLYQSIHPSLDATLSETYGVILYQEQVLRIAHDVAGLSLVDADLLRRAMSHFDPGKQMQTIKERFIQGAFDNQHMPAETAGQIWDMMAAFAGYGFPKAHAASYAEVAWRSAWCKAHYPAYFMAAVLANWGGYYSQRVYLTEARRMGLDIRPPHINHSRAEFSVTWIDNRPILYMGLDQVKELTKHTLSSIIRLRPFASLIDFVSRVNPRRQELENLVKVGAFEGLGTIPDLLQQIDMPAVRSAQLPLFAGEIPQTSPEIIQTDWSLAEKVAAQEELLGTGVSAHILELLQARIDAVKPLNTVEAAAHAGQRVRVAGMRQSWRRGRTSRGDFIYFLSLEDLDGILDVIIPQQVYQRYRSAFSNPGPYLIEGMMDHNPTTLESVMRAERVENLR
jgi:DNA-directed DNA polymerase III PolC